MPYSTEELINILEQELYAAWRGERILLSSAQRIDNPVIAKALDPYKLSKVFAYRDFRDQIHQYQIDHSISGIVWRTCKFRGQSIRFPEINNQLIPIEGDKETLMAAKQSVLDFWDSMTKDYNLWLVAKHHRPIVEETLKQFIEDTEWAELDCTQTELFLGLCWGNPKIHQYEWAKPESGCHRVIAAKDQPSAIKV